MEPAELIARLKAQRISHEKIAAALGRNRVAATNLMNGNRALKAHEVAPLRALLDEEARDAVLDDGDYVAVEIMPTFAGAGAGGNGDGDTEHALVPRLLIEDIFRGRAADFVMVRVRGDSMEPDFRQDDELLVDRRDTNPTQPGPFALWDGDAYLIKNVERSGATLRLFSTNPKYNERTIGEQDDVRIIGRPVWLGRRL